ncbi:T9SS type A sorting domain-containing protein [candidate division KSB1 bacterium]|nr:T9SS type A sorting domain-containing protein [candidate division KSB1 bacterium]
MIIHSSLLCVISILLLNPCYANNLDQAVQHAIETADEKMRFTIEELENDSTKFPITTYFDTYKNWWYWNITTVNDQKTGGWAPGFWPGSLWQLYEITQDDFWLKAARKWSPPIARRLYNGGSDVAVNTFNTFEPWYRLEQSEEHLEILLDGARAIVGENEKNFSLPSGVLGYDRKSDIDGQIHWHAFMDHMPNVELLYWASEHTENSAEKHRWQEIANSHVRIIGETMINPVINGTEPPESRSGSAQRGYYDYRTGEFLFCEAKQGWHHNSTWSRGQAWALYGFASAYAATENDTLLQTTKTIVDYFIDHLPANLPNDRKIANDYVPQWDFDFTSQKDPDSGNLVYPDTDRDSSAGAMGLAGILRLVEVLPDNDPDKWRYWSAAKQILATLCSPDYLAEGLETPAVLLHGCYVHPQSYLGGNAKDLSLIWGEFYFLYSLNLYQKIKPLMTKITQKLDIQPAFSVEQNFPNPFTEHTVIRYHVSRPAQIGLTIYNHMGQTVYIVESRWHDPGTYSTSWNGTSLMGDRVASGVYYYEFSREKQKSVKKMILLN